MCRIRNWILMPRESCRGPLCFCVRSLYTKLTNNSKFSNIHFFIIKKFSANNIEFYPSARKVMDFDTSLFHNNAQKNASISQCISSFLCNSPISIIEALYAFPNLLSRFFQNEPFRVVPSHNRHQF